MLTIFFFSTSYHQSLNSIYVKFIIDDTLKYLFGVSFDTMYTYFTGLLEYSIYEYSVI